MNTHRMVLRILVFLGVVSTLWYFTWWIRRNAFSNPFLLLFFLLMVFYITTQALFVWYVYLHAEKPRNDQRTASRKYSVDVFLPTFNEPIELIEETLRAAVNIRYPHTTYVIDDGRSERVRRAALTLGAKYITRPDNVNFKAGNINNALKESSGEIVAIFDIDHIAGPDFLDRVIPQFNDPQIGVVQVALDHYNDGASLIAASTGKMNDEFFSATMHGMNAMGCAMVFGSNAVFRRSALLSLGGYQPGLAEDLSTSVHMHAGGWKSAYVPEILAKGLLPPDLDAFYKRQGKWSRGVCDVLINEMPALAKRLTGYQRVCYMIRMTYYLAGPVVGIHTLGAILAPFLSGTLEWLGDYFVSSLPFLVSFAAIHTYANQQFALKPADKSLDLRGHLIFLGCWPIYTLGFISALLRRRTRFVATPKTSTGRVSMKYLVPQLAVGVLLLSSLIVHILKGSSFDWGYASLVGLLVVLHLAAISGKVRKRSESMAKPPLFGQIIEEQSALLTSLSVPGQVADAPAGERARK